VLTLCVSADVDIRVRVRGGGHTSQIYAIRQAIAKSIVRLPSCARSTISALPFWMTRRSLTRMPYRSPTTRSTSTSTARTS